MKQRVHPSQQTTSRSIIPQGYKYDNSIPYFTPLSKKGPELSIEVHEVVMIENKKGVTRLVKNVYNESEVMMPRHISSKSRGNLPKDDETSIDSLPTRSYMQNRLAPSFDRLNQFRDFDEMMRHEKFPQPITHTNSGFVRRPRRFETQMTTYDERKRRDYSNSRVQDKIFENDREARLNPTIRQEKDVLDYSKHKHRKSNAIYPEFRNPNNQLFNLFSQPLNFTAVRDVYAGDSFEDMFTTKPINPISERRRRSNKFRVSQIEQIAQMARRFKSKDSLEELNSSATNLLGKNNKIAVQNKNLAKVAIKLKQIFDFKKFKKFILAKEKQLAEQNIKKIKKKQSIRVFYSFVYIAIILSFFVDDIRKLTLSKTYDLWVDLVEIAFSVVFIMDMVASYLFSKKEYFPSWNFVFDFLCTLSMGFEISMISQPLTRTLKR